MKKVIIILPCYFEEAILELSFEKLNAFFIDLVKRRIISDESKICFVDDGSRDNTWNIIEKLSFGNDNVLGIKLSRNFGHQFALLAGLEMHQNNFDSYITIDADLQDDYYLIEEMVLKQDQGISLVYGVRQNRKLDSFFKRKTAYLFYKLMAGLGVDTIHNHADYRLIDNKVLEHFLQFKETHLFLRGVFPLVGFKSDVVYYKRTERLAGETKYPLRKMLSFAWEGITSFSIKPLRIVLNLGFLTLFIAFIVLGWVLYTKYTGQDVQGWSSTILLILFFSSVQMISIGILGEYVGKVYQEVKRRPRYIIEKRI